MTATPPLLLGLGNGSGARAPLALPPTTSRELPAREVCRRTDPGAFDFATTAELEPFPGRIGQQRAREALDFGAAMRRSGYHLYAMGPAETGKHTAVRQFLEERAAARPVPDDVCYVTDFERPHVPRALLLPAGKGSALRDDVAQLVDELGTAIPNALESEEYRGRREAITGELKRLHDESLDALRELADKRHLELLRTPMGLVLAPRHGSEVIAPDDFEKLPAEEQQAFRDAIEEVGQAVRRHAEAEPRWQHDARRKLRDLTRETVRAAVGHLVDDLATRYAPFPAVCAHLRALGDAVVEHAGDFVHDGDDDGPQAAPDAPPGTARGRFLVNLFVDHARSRGAPVVFEDDPRLENLLGRVEHRSHLGTLVTDLHLVKPGALHRANGGYLVLEARHVLTAPYAWDALKRALTSRQVRITSLAQLIGLVSTVSLEPEPVALDVQVVLLGDRRLLYLLEQLDPDFHALFKVAVDFEDDVPRTPEHERLYARAAAAVAREESLRALDRGAVARVVDRCARLAGDSERLSASMGALAELLREADHFAAERGAACVEARDVDAAVDAEERRSGRLRERVQDEIRKGTLIIETSGTRVGQINGLAIAEVGRSMFGHPMRISARVRMGQGTVIDVEREAELGGPIHSKGVLILSGLLAARYAIDRPLSLWATLVFEQSYGGVEGDSASSAELYALLSALSEVPVAQSIAVTGSVNQHGEIQPVGGINEKIEGFFDVCSARGLTGAQGVLVPTRNVRNLMLRRDVVEAVRAARFHVWPVQTVDEGIELLTGMVAGERNDGGRFPEETVNGKVERRLLAFARERLAMSPRR